MPDLFGHDPPEPKRLTAADALERKRAKRRAAEVPRGYAAAPGSGPDGETCGSCRHATKHRYAKTFYKCALFPRQSGWRGTDILLRSPACRKWDVG